MIDKRRYTELELRVVDRLEDELYALGDPIIINFLFGSLFLMAMPIA